MTCARWASGRIRCNSRRIRVPRPGHTAYDRGGGSGASGRWRVLEARPPGGACRALDRMTQATGGCAERARAATTQRGRHDDDGTVRGPREPAAEPARPDLGGAAGIDDDEIGGTALLGEDRAPLARDDARLHEVVVAEHARDVLGEPRLLDAPSAVVRDDGRHATAGGGLRGVRPPGSHRHHAPTAQGRLFDRPAQRAGGVAGGTHPDDDGVGPAEVRDVHAGAPDSSETLLTGSATSSSDLRSASIPITRATMPPKIMMTAPAT